MDWDQLFPKERVPSMEDIEAYIGSGKDLWLRMNRYIQETYQAKPKLTYSGCSGKPGWNVKHQKSGQAFGTLYPEEGGFSVLIVIAYRLDERMQQMMGEFTPAMVERYRNAGDYMKLGKCMMFRIEDEDGLADYLKLLSVKLPPKRPA